MWVGYCFAVGLLLFRRGFITVSPQEFPAPMMHCAKRRPSFVHTKEGKMCLRSALRIPALVRFYLWNIGELTFFTLFAVCVFKGTRAVLSEANYGTAYFYT